MIQPAIDFQLNANKVVENKLFRCINESIRIKEDPEIMPQYKFNLEVTINRLQFIYVNFKLKY